ncbi:MAG: PCMD domain-containing protein [Bacteroidales bacterium]|nr:PCMD domain-containing protein [Bacteroidales bacterium]
MKKTIRIICALAMALSLFSCVKPEEFDQRLVRNDLPYPTLVPTFVSLEVDGALDVAIDAETRNVTVDLNEQVDIRKVYIKKCKVGISAKDSLKFEGRRIEVEPIATGYHDLSNPMKVTLTTYQPYVWTINATQNIARYFSVRGQIGSTYIDAVNHRVIVYVSSKVDITDMEVLTCKLGPDGITEYSRTLSEMKDFSQGMSISLTTKYGVEETWSIFVEVIDFSVDIKKINPWTTEAYITADGIAGEDNGFRYRKAGEDVWNILGKANVTSDGGSYTGQFTGLEPSTEYEVLAYSGAQESETKTFTTAPDTQLPNHSFEVVTKVTGKDYYKWFDPMNADPLCQKIWWASGNGEGPDGLDGTATMGVILTVPDSADGKWAVCAQSSKLAGILACGNIFTGQFTEIIGGAAGAVHYGRPWSTRPKALVLSYKYQGGLVDCVDDYPVDDVVKLGDKDRCQIFVGVGDWDYHRYGGSADSPVRVSTAKNERSTLFTPSSPGIIGCGNFVTNETVTEWTELRIPLDYRSLDRMPTHIIIICAVNYRGDYMTGCSTAKLWLDNMRLEY